MDNRIGVLVVDDSAFMRKIISTLIEFSTDMYVIGKARNGLDALEKIQRLKPDLVTLDSEMPKLNGLDALRRIMKECPTPVIMVSDDAESTLEAFEIGAVDFIIKESLVCDLETEDRNAFHQRMIQAAEANLPNRVIVEKQESVSLASQLESCIVSKATKRDLIVIGSSTGGPAALQKILTRFPRNFPVPILVIQHMPPGFTKPLAERFNRLCELQVKEAEQHEALFPGTVYIAPAGLQTTIERQEGQYTIKLQTSANIHTLYKPSIDVALQSAAPLVKDRLLVVILTGMGDDGLKGSRSVKALEGVVLTEAEETCIVYGMPKVVNEAGLADKSLAVYDLFDEIIESM